jgi:hypothetical protein
MVLEILLSALGVIITTGSLVYAIKTAKEKKERDRLVREKLAGIAGNIAFIRKSAQFADTHFSKISNYAQEMDRSDDVKGIVGESHKGARDAVAATRMLANLLGDVLALQRGLFETEDIRHPDRDTMSVANEPMKAQISE